MLSAMPELSAFTVAPTRKLLPFNVTLTLVPGAPELGLMEVNVGGSALIVKLWVPLVPPAVVTLMFAEPTAFAERASVAVI